MIPENNDAYGTVIDDADAFVFPIDLPGGFQYRFETFSWIDEVMIKFGASFGVNCHDEDQVMEWFGAFQNCCFTSMKKNKKKRRKVNTRGFIFKEGYVCKHAYSYASNQMDISQHGHQRKIKCISCPMHMTLCLRKISEWSIRTSGADLADYPLKVQLLFDHNHRHFCAQSLQSNKVSASIQHDV